MNMILLNNKIKMDDLYIRFTEMELVFGEIKIDSGNNSVWTLNFACNLIEWA